MTEKLFTEFPPVSTQEWETQIIRDLKGADYEKKLVWKTLEGFSVRPYYRTEDLKDLPYLNTLPGEFPYLRGTKTVNDWLIHQTFHATGRYAQANREAHSALDRGLESVGFRFKENCAVSFDDIKVLLNGIYLPAVEISFEHCGTSRTDILDAFIKYVQDNKIDPGLVRARFDFDPLGRSMDGDMSLEDSLSRLAECIEKVKDFPLLRIISVSGYAIHEKGSGIVQELAFALALASEYVQRLSAKGVNPSVAAAAIQFHFAVGSNYFMEIAKFRAGRMFWALQLKEMGITSPDKCRMHVHAVTSPWNQTIYDMYVNLLRGTTQAMSAAIAGVDSLEVLSFDSALRDSDPFSRRLARNIQIILKEEAHFNKVADPAAGSYYVENLTALIFGAAKELFSQTLERGGYTGAYQSGWIPSLIEETAALRMRNIATRKEILLGVNQYPDFTEKAPRGLSMEILEKTTRGATTFEKMRFRTELSGLYPKAFMLTFGNLAMCRARAQFASNFFAVAGIEIIDNNKFASIEEGVRAALASGAQIVVACSSDEEYAQAVPQIAEGLGGKVILVVAGEPACKEELITRGITHFISVRSNVLETLSQYQQELGI